MLQVTTNKDDPINCPKVLVFLPLLLALFSICRKGGCGSSVDLANTQLSWKGACLTITATCNANHVTKVRETQKLELKYIMYKRT